MGYVKKRISELSREHGSKTRAVRFSESWFNDSLTSRSLTEAQYTRNRFKPGQIYVFQYSPKYKDELPWFDENPIVLAIEGNGNNDCGVNLNLLPTPVKEKLLDDLYSKMNAFINSTISEKKNPINEKPLRITYDGMKSYLEKYGCDFALRQYIPSRKKKQAVVSYSRWPEIALCNFIELNGTTLMAIKIQFKDYLKRNI
jgi:hypothetical protein